jgi:hypothetical protein
MPLYLTRPDYLHRAANVLSSTSEAGLTVAEPSADTGNDGTLRLRCSGTPTAAEAITVELSTGGGPYGYGASGSAAKWRRTSEAADKQRGYIDSTAFIGPFLLLDIGNQGISSTPREIADGTLGFLTPDGGALDIQFRRYSTAGVSVGGATLPVDMWTALARPDLVVLPSGRLVAIVPTSPSGELTSCYSDDDGDTWAVLAVSDVGSAGDQICAEVVGDDVVVVRSNADVSMTGEVQISRDGGATFTIVGTGTVNLSARTCALDGVVYLVDVQGITLYVRPITPGGGFGTAVSTGVACNGAYASGCIIARDDGTLWVFATESTADGTLDMGQAVSTDGGLTWTVTATSPLTLVKTAYANSGYFRISGGMFGARMIVIAETDHTTGGASGPHLLKFGEWSNEGHNAAGKAYLPLDYPEAFGWTRTNTGAGATVTNSGPLKLVTTLANYTDYQAPTTIWGVITTSATIQFAIKVVAGTSLSAKQIRLRADTTDGTDAQGIQLTFSTTGARCVDGNNTQIGSDLTIGLSSDVYEFLVGLKFDALSAGTGRVSIWYRVRNAETWTNWITSGAVSEVLGSVGQRLKFGAVSGAVAGTESDWHFVSVETAGVGDLATDTAELAGRALSSAHEYRVVSGINLGAYGTGGVSGDTYALSTRYTYGKDRTWAELRPSARTQSTADNATWSVVFYAGGTDKFKGDLFAAFGTNMRQAKWQMNDTDSWGTPSIDQPLDATLTSFTVGAGVRGLGYVGPTVSPNWRPGQWKSNGDSRRYFLDIAGTVYEITDNDEDRLYVDSTDLSAASGTAYIFGDRMAATFTFGQYKYARFAVTSAQQTADNVYRLGTPIVGKKWSPDQLYDFGFVDRIEPNVTTVDVDNGASMSYRRGPQIDTLSIQWPPLDRLVTDVELRLRDFYRSIDGSLTPVVLWRASTDLSTLSLVQVREVYSASNVLGELANAVTRVDQLVLREVW